MIRNTTAAIATCLAIACADEVPGVDPPLDELYFPIGIAAIPGPPGETELIAVSSSDFDQRFNAGTLIAFSAEQLFELAGDGSAGVTFVDSLESAAVGGVRIYPFTGDLAYGQTEPDGTGHLFVAARGFNRVVMVDVTPTPAEGVPVLTCRTEGAETLSTTDCSQAYVLNTGFSDPFSLAFAPESATRAPLVGIGHSSALQENDVIFGAVALADVSLIEARVAAERDGMPLPEAIRITRVAGFGGVSGIAFAGEILGLDDSFLTAGFSTAPELLLTSFQVETDPTGLFFLDPGPRLRLGAEISAIEMRSLAVADTGTSTGAARRAYGSVRFFAQGDSFNSGIAVVDLTGDSFTVLSVLELGEELQRPFVREVRGPGGTLLARHLYVGDIRLDKVYIVDVTTDVPVLIQELDGTTTRTIDGTPVQVNLLDGPSQIAFATRGGRTLAFVTNFANSTLAVIDVTDQDPTTHRIIARLGRNIDAEGEMEGP